MNLDDIFNHFENLDGYDQRNLIVDLIQLYYNDSTGRGDIELKWVSPSVEFTEGYNNRDCYTVSQVIMDFISSGELPDGIDSAQWNEFFRNI